MDVTKPYKFIRFRAVDVPKRYRFIRFGAMDVTKPYEFIVFGAMDVTNPNQLCGLDRVNLAVNRAEEVWTDLGPALTARTGRKSKLLAW